MQHKSDNPDQNIIVPEEGQSIRSDLCCNNVGRDDCPSLGLPIEFTNEQMGSFVELALILKRIHIRLITEGYRVNSAGKLVPPPSNNSNEKPNSKRYKRNIS